MPAIFCLRLAFGLLAALLLVPAMEVNPRFFRVQFLTCLGLTAVAGFFLLDRADTLTWWLLGSSVAVCFLGSLVWSINNAPGGQIAIILGTLASLGALTAFALSTGSELNQAFQLAEEYSSAMMLGTAMSAMLMGHSYLIAPSMSLTPLLRLLGGLFAALALRAGLAGAGLWFWTREHSLAKLDDVTIFLPLRWGLGILGPFILGIMAWQTARIRSTQSATGILYVVVILAFLGELVALVLMRLTGTVL